MRIKHIHIEGFGKLIDVKFTDLHEGLTLIEGPNEAGKSTIMSFIRAMMFGIPSRRYREERYDPVHGTIHGGSLILEDQYGVEYRIERKGNQLSISDSHGRQGGEEMLKQLLGGVSQGIFKNIFAFGLTELQQLDSLQGDEISGYIYSAGMGTGGISVVQAERKMEDKLGELFKPKGRTPLINQTLGELRDLESELERLSEQASEYDQLTLRLRDLEEELSNKNKELSDCQDRRNWLQRLVQGREIWVLLFEGKERLKAMPEIIQFPENGLIRLQQMEDQIKELDVEISALGDKKREIEEKISSLTFHEGMLERKEEFEFLFSNYSSILEKQSRIHDLSHKTEQLNKEIEEKISLLGPFWTEEKIKGFETSISNKNRVREIQGNLSDVFHSIEEIKREIDRYVEEENRMKEEAEQILEQMGLNRWNKEELKKKEEALQSVRTLKGELENKKLTQTFLLDKKRGIEEQISLFAGKKNAGKSSPWPSMLTFFIGSGLSIYLWLNQFSFGALISFFAFFILSIVLWLGRKSSGSGNSDLQTMREQKMKELQEIEQQIEGLDEEIFHLSQKLKPLSDLLGLRNLEEVTLYQVEEEIREERKKNEKNEQIQDQIKQIEYRRKKLNEILEKEKLKRIEKEEILKGLKQMWREWLEKNALPEDISIETMMDMFPYVERAKDLIREREECKENIQMIQEQTDRFEQKVMDLIADTGIISQENKNLSEIIIELKKAVEENLRCKELKERYQLESSSVLEQLDILQRKRKKANQEMEEILAAGGTDDPEEFRRRDKIYHDRKDLEDKLIQLQSQLVIIAGSKEAFEKMESEWLSTDESALTEQLERVRGLELQLKEDISQLLDKKGQVKKQLADLESSDILSEKRQELEEKKSLLRQQVKEWCVLSLCKNLLKNAREVYERERQPSVVKGASQYFNTMTGGRYQKMISPLDEKKLLVVTGDGRQLEPYQLSRGTAEQLYLSMRFSLAGEFSRKVSLPLILDDIFVNFDPERLHYAIDTLAEVSRNHQILLFTCHPHVSGLIQTKGLIHKYIQLTAEV
ncbi:AAA family ATPase [Microaerobacter geothermalis]|uniref:AAA family ATPase n=1 Tax=Microaerobacter geothermalis TaxID=674972 RepID=UPI001F44848D|nr:AAA family ATPase [Microaerobacter geothermalis]MCF6094719.1 AAA family ATPase [Microaerobacter geothermalis]